MLYGGNGNDELYGGTEDASDDANDGQDMLYGEAGNDEMYGGGGDDTLDGGSGNDELYGGGGKDTLMGGSGRDEINGGDGDDTIDGGSGDDDLTGGEGQDTFRFARNGGDDTIEDFIAGEDKIDLRAFTNISGFDDSDLRITERSGDVEIDLPGSGTIELEDVSGLSADDFIFVGDSSGDDDGDGDGDGDGDDDDDSGTPVVGDADPDRLHGTAGADNLNGGGGNDVLYGSRGNDTLTGGAGVDSYEGGPGDDTLVVDYADFTDGKATNPGDRTDAGVIDGGPGSDTLSFADFRDVDGDGDGVRIQGTFIRYKGNIATDILGVGTGSDGITGSVFINIEHFIGSRYDDDITGTTGNDIIEGGAGQDELDGGAGTMDTVSYRSSSSSVTIRLAAAGSPTNGLKGHAAGDTLENFENIIGSAHDDILTGNASNNVIEGLAGADTLDGGAGIDTLSYVSSNAAVTIDLNQGTGDFDDNTNTIKTASGGHAAGDKIRYESFENVRGSAFGDSITGDNNNNVLDGGPGGDQLNGDDEAADDGFDIVTYANAAAGVTVDLSSVSESNGVITIRNSSGQGDARGDTFIDIERFVGSNHDDFFYAGPNPDYITGGGGTDTISYERSTRAAVVVDIPNTDVDTNTQTGNGSLGITPPLANYKPYETGDTLLGFENIIGTNVSTDATKVNGTGDGFHDVLTGNGSANVIEGRGGNDMISGGEGDDTLIGGRGDDTLTGDGGRDTFVFSRGDGDDTITGFDPTATGDILDLSAFGRGFYITAQVDGDGNVTNENVIRISSSQEINVGTAITGLNEANFRFNNDGNDSITGTSGVNYIWGGAGNDRINGGNGNDRLHGGSGDDVINGQAGGDTLDGGAGTDTLSYAGSPQARDEGNNIIRNKGVTVTLGGGPADVAANRGTYAEGDMIGANFENLIGSSYDDMLTGDTQPNVIEGGSGNDIIMGGGSSEGIMLNTLKGGSGSDVITGGGNSKVEGGSQSDRLIGSPGDFLSYEGSGSAVTVDLNDITNRVLTPAEVTRFNGDGSASLAIIKVSRGDATGDIATGFNNIIGSCGADTLTGNSEANMLRGMGGNDTLKGGGGNDTLEGGPGRDKLEGGAGTADIATYANATAGITLDLSGGNASTGDAAGDTFEDIERYVGSSYDDTFIAGRSADNIDGGADGSDTVSYIRSNVGVMVTLDGTANETGGYAAGDTLAENIVNIIGSNFADTLTAASGGSAITGGRGDDTLTGAAGSDTFVFASGDGDDEINQFTITGGQDKIDLSAFNSIASMDDLKDDISDRGGDIEIDLPNGGELRLNAPTGFNNTDNDFHGLTPDNFIFYTKKISGSIGDRFNNEINGTSSANTLYGEDGKDTINGGAGDDEIYGGEDNDTLNGGAGNDWLDGGPGDDRFVFEPGHGDDYIMDFETTRDKIDLSAFKNDAGEALIGSVTIPEAENGIIVIDLTSYEGGGTITIFDSAIVVGDFVLM